jgi:CxxC-x17-CxxC domain-containing protein
MEEETVEDETVEDEKETEPEITAEEETSEEEVKEDAAEPKVSEEKEVDSFKREMHKAVCADCGKDCEVPFTPTEGRPVYCRDCYRKHVPQRRRY